MIKRLSVVIPVVLLILMVSSETAFARNYSPALGRFLQRDPVPMPNLYTYVANRPTYYADPYGLQGQQRAFLGRIKYGAGECCCTLKVCSFILDCPQIPADKRKAQVGRFLTGLEQAQQIFEKQKDPNSTTDITAVCLEFADLSFESYGKLAGGEHGTWLWDPRAGETIKMPRVRSGISKKQFDDMMQDYWLPELEKAAKRWAQPYPEEIEMHEGYCAWKMRAAAQCDINIVLGCKMLKGPGGEKYPGYAQTGGAGTTIYISPMSEDFAKGDRTRYPGLTVGHEIGHLLGLYHPGEHPQGEGVTETGNMQTGSLSGIKKEEWSKAAINRMLKNCKQRQ